MAIEIKEDKFMGTPTDTYNRNHRVIIDFTNGTCELVNAKYFSGDTREEDINNNAIYGAENLGLTEGTLNQINTLIYLARTASSDKLLVQV
jgi:hypothetical protein